MSAVVPLIRQYWGLLRRRDDGRIALDFAAREPSAAEVKASAGVLLLTGMLAGDCPAMTIDIVGELPRQPRFDLVTAVTDAAGIAAITFSAPFATAPKVQVTAVPRVLAGPIKAELVSVTATGCKVKVTTAALATGAVTALAGATVSAIAIEA